MKPGQPRLCGPHAYCSSLRAGGRPGPLCPGCAEIGDAVALFERTHEPPATELRSRIEPRYLAELKRCEELRRLGARKRTGNMHEAGDVAKRYAMCLRKMWHARDYLELDDLLP